MPVFRHLARLTSALAGALTVDDTAKIVLTELLGVENVSRVGLALSQGAGRELRFVSSDADALSDTFVRWCAIDAFSDVPLVRTVRTGEPVYLHDESELKQEFAQFAARQLRMGTRSLATVPLVVDDVCLGALLVCWSRPQELGHEQRGFLSAFAAQVAHAVRRGLAFQEQRTTSEELQRSLLPHSLPDVERLDFGAHYRPGSGNVDVGGDWYDVLVLADGSVAVSLGDVMGKGVQAAVVMGEIRSAARAYALLDPEPSRVLERLDGLVTSTAPSEQLITMVFAVIDPDRTTVRLSVAGHPPPFVVPASGEPVLVDAPLGPALGLGAGPWQTGTVRLDHGETLLLYSDGLVESRERDLFSGIEVLRQTITTLEDRQRSPRDLCTRLAETMVSERTYDDVTLLAVAPTAQRTTATRTFPADTSAPRLARRFTCEVLTGWSVDEVVVERAELCVSELVTNAVMHTGTEPTLTLSSDGAQLLVTVQDNGTQQRIAPAEEPDVEGVSGRGLSLVQAMVSAWNVQRTTGGTTVWCELDLDPATSELDLLAGFDDLAM